MSRRLLVRGGRVVDPAAGRNGRADVLLENGLVAQVADRLEAGDAEVFDASKLHVFPGFIDLHAHLREPGREYAETIHTGLRAAAAGGFTAVCAMPNTSPVNDSREVCEFVRARGLSAGSARLHPIAAITMGQKGEAMTAFGELKEAGAVAVSDDGKWLEDGALLRAAFEHAGLFGLPVVQHAEDRSLSQGAPMHEGAVSTRLGLSGQPALAEAAAVARDLLVAELTRGRLHVAHLSTAKALDMVRRAKASGLAVTCEVTPHHLVLTDEEVATTAFSTRVKMNPPLREASDVAALAAGLADGTVDAIATDHAPHHADEKAVDFDTAPFGVVGLETAASVVYDRLVARGRLTLERFVALFTAGPAKAFGLPGGTLAPGSPADLTLFDTEARWKVDPDRFVSKGRSTPFSGWELGGAPAATIVAGNVVWQRVEL
ncbi:MAG TPA: dihydroorotase [Thermoanaerobaculia bacterium]|nr:dihydroorotase [Thermoanaerobaculia bacterium]